MSKGEDRFFNEEIQDDEDEDIGHITSKDIAKGEVSFEHKGSGGGGEEFGE